MKRKQRRGGEVKAEKGENSRLEGAEQQWVGSVSGVRVSLFHHSQGSWCVCNGDKVSGVAGSEARLHLYVRGVVRKGERKGRGEGGEGSR